MNSARMFRIRALSVRVTIAWLEAEARHKPFKAALIIPHIRKLKRLLPMVDKMATSASERAAQSGSGSASSDDGRGPD